MKNTGWALGIAMAVATLGSSTQAASIVFVSGAGSDGECSRAAPCAFFADAMDAVDVGGTIRCLDSSNFANVLIRKPVTIDCGGTGAAIYTVASAVLVDIDRATYPGAVVTIRGLTIQGLRQEPDARPNDGIQVRGGGETLIVEDCRIEGFREQGIDFAPSSSVQLIVRDTTISNNAEGGVLIAPGSGVNLRATFNDVNFDRNGPYGLQARDGALVSVSDSTAAHNVVGIFAASFNRGVDVMLDRMALDSNSRALVGAGANGSVRVGNSLITGSARALDGNVISLGGNMLTDNAADGTFKSTIAKR